MAYGKEPLQYGELRIPKGPGPHPVAVIIHGGCWLAKYNLDHIGNVCAALTRAGVATWSLEYRRVGDPGGGWPGTFQDIARGTDHLRALARLHHLDVERVVAVGHSAGGQLALWLGARGRLPKDSPLYTSDPLPLRGVVSLAGVTDLRKFRQECGDVVGQLLGGAPESLIESRYALTSPIEMLPFGVAQRLIHGDRDQEVSLKLVQDYEAAAKKKGDDAELIVLEGAGHFELIAPPSSAWPVVQRTVLSVLKSGGK
jgi:acetyl esterase/lipase